MILVLELLGRIVEVSTKPATLLSFSPGHELDHLAVILYTPDSDFVPHGTLRVNPVRGRPRGELDCQIYQVFVGKFGGVAGHRESSDLGYGLSFYPNKVSIFKMVPPWQRPE